jgi:hypothetical protein
MKNMSALRSLSIFFSFGIGFAASYLFATLSLKAHGNESDEKLSCLRQRIFGHQHVMPG